MCRYESETAGGKVESKEHILDERDELWVRAHPRLPIQALRVFLGHKVAQQREVNITPQPGALVG